MGLFPYLTVSCWLSLYSTKGYTGLTAGTEETSSISIHSLAYREPPERWVAE